MSLVKTDDFNHVGLLSACLSGADPVGRAWDRTEEWESRRAKEYRKSIVSVEGHRKSIVSVEEHRKSIGSVEEHRSSKG